MPVSAFLVRSAFLLLIPACLQSGEADRALQPGAGVPQPAPDVPQNGEAEPKGINWRGLLIESFQFLALEHGFRYATEEGTVNPRRPFFRGYKDSIENLHGWADGDPFYVSYVGHPMQGAVSGFLFVRNDRGYRTVTFGKDRAYWKSRLRAAAWAWAYSEQFEIGPLSEASIGNTQASFPQQGFVDQVVTPVIGLGWMIAEDAIDRSLIRSIENRTENRYVRILARGGLNPARSLANMLAGKVPWDRDPRTAGRLRTPETRQYPAVPSFQFTAASRFQMTPGEGGRGGCAGGGGTAGFRISPHWELVGDVSGCKLIHPGDNLSGDSLTWMIGWRRISRPLKRWQPYVQFLAGGRKMTWEEIDPVKRAQVTLAAREGRPLDFDDHLRYTRVTEASGLAVSTGAGLDLRVNSALGIRLGEVGYTRSWHARFEDLDYSHSVELTAGLVLRWGTW
jgi:hypothetical protein